jgi:hypothetical protein
MVGVIVIDGTNVIVIDICFFGWEPKWRMGGCNVIPLNEKNSLTRRAYAGYPTGPAYHKGTASNTYAERNTHVHPKAPQKMLELD